VIQCRPHHINGGRPAGPNLEGSGTLVEEHGTTLCRPTAPQVKEALIRSQPGSGRKVRGCAVHHQVYLCQRFLHVIKVDWPTALNPEIRTQALRLLEVPRNYPDLIGRGLQRGGNRARGPTRADNGDLVAPTLPSPEGGGRIWGRPFCESAKESLDVRIPPLQSRTLAGDGVHGSNPSR